LKKIFSIIALFFAISFAGNGPVSYYGKLNVSGNKMIGSKTGSTPVQIRGVSFGWTSYEGVRFYTANAVEHMVNDWKAEVVRAAYGATSVVFTSNATAKPQRERVEAIVDAAIANDIYVIIDWHSHNAHNEVQNSKDFFKYMAEKYGSYDNVIFEIYNEPLCQDGSTTYNCTGSQRTTWAEVKTYAEQIIPVIREYSSNLILVGTPLYSQEVQTVVGNAINDSNVGYVVHFYAYSHPLSNFSAKMNQALDNNLFIFVTEYSTVHSDGGASTANHYDTHNAERTDEWHAYMDEKKISSAAWQVNDKYEGAAFFGIEGALNKFDMAGSWTDQSLMTASGKYVFNKLNAYAVNAPWRSASPIQQSVNLASFDPANTTVYSLSGKKLGNLANANLKDGVYILISKQNGVVQKKVLKIVK